MGAIVAKLLFVGVAAFVLYRASKDSPGPRAGTSPTSPNPDPIIGQVWDMTVPDPFLPGARMPAVPVTLGGSVTGWYHPVSDDLVAIANSTTRVVIGRAPTTHFPAKRPG